MSRHTRSTQQVLLDARGHFMVVLEYSERDLSDQLTVDAICMRLSAGIETLAALEADERSDLFGDAWPMMWGLRNRIAHGYLLVDTDIVASTVERDVPQIVTRIENALDRLS